MADLIKITTSRYAPARKSEWNSFLHESNVDCFLFQRDFMDYHADRFLDHSLIFESEEKIIAVLPAHAKDGQLSSHNGLTFGGLIQRLDLDLNVRRELYSELDRYAADNRFKTLALKVAPDYYLKNLDQSSTHFLHGLGFQLSRVDQAFVLDQRDKIELSSRRKRGVKNAVRDGLAVKLSDDFPQYWNKILLPNLKEKFGAAPVHSLDEMVKLSLRFPEQIKLFSAFDAKMNMVGGIIFFANQNVVHTQYISSNEEGRKSGALDLVAHEAMVELYPKVRYFSFGTSMEDSGRQLNWGLANWKLEFGARIYSHHFFTKDYNA